MVILSGWCRFPLSLQRGYSYVDCGLCSVKMMINSFLKQCLHDLHFVKTRSLSANLSKLDPALEFVSKELNQLAAIFHVYAEGLIL